MDTRPDLTPTRPALSWVSHAWRYAVCLVISVAVWQGVAVTEARDHRLLFAAELVLGLLAYVLVFFRRRAPVRIALVIAAMSAFSGIAAGPATLAAVSVATLRAAVAGRRRRPRQLRGRAVLHHDRRPVRRSTASPSPR